jgi:hypothetical protein
MFQAFGFGGAPCARCGHTNLPQAQYCAQCGLAAGTPRHEAVLRDNRWVAGPDEFAVFFGVEALDGLFVKTLRVPAATRAYILQGDQATEVPQGEYEIEGFFTRLNNLLRDRHAEILITRTAALPVPFAFEALRSAEGLALAVDLTVAVRIENVAAFARYFMTMPGTVAAAHLRELLAPVVRQLAAEFVAGQSLREMAANTHLRAQFDERIHGALQLHLAQFGLAAVQVDTLELRHDAARGSIDLVAATPESSVERARRLDQLYSDEEWQRIWREEQEARVRFRRAELRQDEAVDQRELSLRQMERMQAIRVREIELYGRIAESQHRKQAVDRGAAEVLAQLEHAQARDNAGRAGEAMEWAHVRELARLRMRTELEAAQHDAGQAQQLARQQFMHKLLEQQVQAKITQAATIADAARRREELARLHGMEQEVARQAAALDSQRHTGALQALELEQASRRREAERAAEYEEELALERKRELTRAAALHDATAAQDVEQVTQRIEALRRDGTEAAALAQHEKLLRTIDADALHARRQQELALEAEAQRLALRTREHEAQWQHELARMDALAQASDSAKLVLAPVDNAALLADVMKAQVYAGMNADQLQALAAPTAEADVRACANGHALRAGERFCPQCGAAASP